MMIMTPNTTCAAGGVPAHYPSGPGPSGRIGRRLWRSLCAVCRSGNPPSRNTPYQPATIIKNKHATDHWGAYCSRIGNYPSKIGNTVISGNTQVLFRLDCRFDGKCWREGKGTADYKCTISKYIIRVCSSSSSESTILKSFLS